MAKIRHILDRRSAVRNIRTVTHTMEMVASSRFQKLFRESARTRAYTEHLDRLVGDILTRPGGEALSHPLLIDPADTGSEVVMVLTSNRGLCGGYNTAVLDIAMRRRMQLVAAGYGVELHVVGKRGAAWLRQRNVEVEESYEHLADIPSTESIEAVADTLSATFLAGEITGLEIAYTQFISAARQRPAIAALLPVGALEPAAAPSPTTGEVPPLELHPSPQELLDELLPAVVRLRLRQCFVDAAMSQHVTRYRTMQAATENADEMIQELTSEYNQLRQSQITTELTELVGGQAVLAAED
ncbi:MAG: ATP synthase F1 subunit gamma [Planctomycetota bacterium]|jgi:F-type H+-transporting ATPase subunit gamma